MNTYDYDECFRETATDNIERYNEILSTFEKIKEIDPKLDPTFQETIKSLLKNEVVRLKEYSAIHKMAEGTILGYEQLINLCLKLLVIHFVLNVILIPSEVFVNFVKTEITIIDTDSIIWFVKRLSSSVKILNIAVHFLFLYKIAKDMIYFSLCLRSKEFIEKMDVKKGNLSVQHNVNLQKQRSEKRRYFHEDGRNVGQIRLIRNQLSLINITNEHNTNKYPRRAYN